jgi:phasin family protein
MKNELFTQWVEFSKGAVEPMVRLNEITAQAMERVARQQLDMARDYMEMGQRHLKLLGEAKDPQRLLSDEGQLAAEFGKKLMARAEEFLQIAGETQKAVAGWGEDVAAKAAAGVKPKGGEKVA